MNKPEYVVLVDENDQIIGSEEKIKAHEMALRHRAFSVFIYRSNPLEILIHQRHPGKYHCGSLWTNTCCGHPRVGEDTIAAGERRLMEEMGINANLSEVGIFEYKSQFNNGLTEHEIDHVLAGELTKTSFTVNPEELIDHRWTTIDQIEIDLSNKPEHYTPWLPQALKIFKRSMGSDL
jgi:isopentenyl-diphosphate delta-isomerase